MKVLIINLIFAFGLASAAIEVTDLTKYCTKLPPFVQKVSDPAKSIFPQCIWVLWDNESKFIPLLPPLFPGQPTDADGNFSSWNDVYKYYQNFVTDLQYSEYEQKDIEDCLRKNQQSVISMMVSLRPQVDEECLEKLNDFLTHFTVISALTVQYSKSPGPYIPNVKQFITITPKTEAECKEWPTYVLRNMNSREKTDKKVPKCAREISDKNGMWTWDGWMNWNWWTWKEVPKFFENFKVELKRAQTKEEKQKINDCVNLTFPILIEDVMGAVLNSNGEVCATNHVIGIREGLRKFKDALNVYANQ